MISKYSVLFACFLVLSACGGGSSTAANPTPPAVNNAPVVNAGLDATIRLPSDTADLDATVSDDGLPAGAVLSTAWSVQSGPAGATFADVNAVDTTVTFVSEGTYVLELTAHDTALPTSDTVTVIVEAAPAVADVAVSPADVSVLTGGTQLFSASGTDQYGDSIPVNVTWSASGGTIDQAGNYTAGGVTGAFVVTATDGAVSGNANVTISDSPPSADAGGPYMGVEGTAVALDGSNSSDANNDIVAYDWDLDNDGAYDDASGVTTTFGSGGSGIFTIGLRVTDGDGATDSDTTTVTVANLAPTASAQSVSTGEDTPLPITLTGSDPGSDPLTFAIATGPANGTLSGTAPNVTYTPNSNYNGPDSFTFTVDDGEFTSAEATVSITVNTGNDVPTADDQSVSTDEDTPLAITLTGSDPETDPLTYAIGTGPTNGTLSGTAPDVTYTPNADYNGPDSFTFTVNDGEFTSAEATVSITVNAVNDAPTADDQSASTDEDTPLAITLTGSDPETDPLTYAIGTGPSNGTLSGTAPDVTYTPNADYNGPDSFTFTVNDSEFTSAEATVSITVTTVNDAPTADDQSVSTNQDTPLAITLTGSDPESDPLTFAIGTGPTNGTLSGTAPDVTYTPNSIYNGPDSFTFTVNDGEFTSAEATVSITVNDNVAPAAPTSLSASIGDGQVSLDWANNIEPDLAGYRVYRSETQGGPYGTAISGLLTSSSYLDTTAVNGTTYYYIVTAEDAIPNVSPVSAEVTATPSGAVHAYWKLDENTGTTTADTVLPDDGSGTIVGANWTTGVSGAALDFNGSGDNVVIDNTQALNITGTEISLVAWINPRSGGASGGSRVISKRTNAFGGEVYAMYTDNYRLRFRLDGIEDMTSSHILRLNDWLHVAMVYDGVDMRIYVNGVLDVATPRAKSDPIDSSSRAVQLGRREGEARYFDGIIDEAQVLNRALSAAEVAAMHGAVTPPSTPPGLYFTDITADAKTGGPVDGGHGVMFAEVDANSLPDLYLTNNFENTTARRDYYFINLDGAEFLEDAVTKGIADLDGGSHGAVWADLDNDGDYDLFNGTTWDGANPVFGNPENDNVYRNDAGVFTDVTPASILSTQIETRGVTAFDWDADGDLDLFGVPGSQPPAATEAFRNDGGFAFSVHVGGDLSTAIAMQGVIDTDFDGDGDIDILSGNRVSPPNDGIAILQNDGTGVFTQIAPASLGITDDADDGITTADVDNDGDLDMLLVSDGTGDLYLRDNTGMYSNTQTFTSVEGYMGGFADLDNDGDLDLVFAGDERVFINDGSGSFASGQSVPVSGINDPRGIAFADIDSDGDLDFAIAAKRSANWMVRNDYDAGNNWLSVKLVSPNGQAGAFGAKVWVRRTAANGGALIGMREAKGNHGYLAQDNPVLHFGLGANLLVDVTVDFVDGSQTVCPAQAADRRIVISGAVCPPP